MINARFLALVPLLALGAHLSAGAKELKYVKARISFFSDEKGKPYAKPRTLLVTNAAEIEKLLACFPGLGSKKLPLRPAGWNARANIVFMPKKGSGSIVYLNGGFDLWSNLGAYGDARPKPAIKPLMAEAEKKAKAVD